MTDCDPHPVSGDVERASQETEATAVQGCGAATPLLDLVRAYGASLALVGSVSGEAQADARNRASGALAEVERRLNAIRRTAAAGGPGRLELEETLDGD